MPATDTRSRHPRSRSPAPPGTARGGGSLPPPASRRSNLPLCLTAALLLSSVAQAHLPQAGCVFYGQVRDEFGIPYTRDAEVVLRLDSVEVTRTKVNGALAPGVNFRLNLPLDDGQGAPYADYAARPGQPVQLLLRVGGNERLLTQTHAPAAGQPGEFVAIYVSTGEDDDRDGLPDDWERELIANSGGLFQSLAEVHPEDDFDGDGLTNLDEYRAGTYAFLAWDFLALEEMTRLADGRARLRFLTTPGITYQIHASATLGPEADWQPVPFALAEDAGFPHAVLLGHGFYVDLFVPASDSLRFFRLSAR